MSTLIPSPRAGSRIQPAISLASVVTLPFISDALTLLLSTVGSRVALRLLSFFGSKPALSSEQTASTSRETDAFCRYSRRIWATSAMDGHSTMDMPPAGVSSSTILSEMRVLPVPQGRIILPRASPIGSPPLSERSCSPSRRTLVATASSCMADLVCRHSSPSGFGPPGLPGPPSSEAASACCCWRRSLVM